MSTSSVEQGTAIHQKVFAGRSALEAWWDRNNIERRAAMSKPRPLPEDGAAWAYYVIFFATVGLADAQIKVEYIRPLPIMNRMLELWRAKKSQVQVGE